MHTHAHAHMHAHMHAHTHMHIHIVVMCGIIYTSCGVLRHFWEESYLNCCIPLICSRLEPASVAKCHFVTFSAVYCDCRHAHTCTCMHTCMHTHMHIHIVVMCGIIYTSCGVLRHFWEESYLNCCIPLICSRLEPASMAKCHFVTFSAVYCDCRHAHTCTCMHTCMHTHMHIHIVVMCGIIYTSCGVLRHFWEESYLNCCIPLICSRLEPASMAKCHFVTFSAVYCDCRHFLPALCFLRQ